MSVIFLVFTIVALLVIGIGLVVGAFLSVLAMVLVGTGILSASVLFGFFRGRASAFGWAAALQFGAASGAACGLGLAFVISCFWETPSLRDAPWLSGAFGGAAGGLLVALLAVLAIRKLSQSPPVARLAQRLQNSLIITLLLLLAPLASFAQSSSPEQLWQRVTALDSGPERSHIRTQADARLAAVTHLAKQEAALRAYLTAEPRGSHAFEASLRLARLLQLRSGFQETETGKAEAARLLADAATLAQTPAQRAELDFAQVALQMRTVRVKLARDREELLTTVRRFQQTHAGDRRLPALLTEVATLYDVEPETKRALLRDALATAKDDGLKARIGDELRKLDAVGLPLDAEFPSRTGGTIRLASYRGKVVVLLFFAEFSPPSVEALTAIQRLAPTWPADQVQVVAYSIDSSAEDLSAFIRRQNVPFPVGFDGRGWHGSVPRALGINSLPTVWILDKQGRLRSLRGLEGVSDQVWQYVRASGR